MSISVVSIRTGKEKCELTVEGCAGQGEARCSVRAEEHGVQVGEEVEACAIKEDLHSSGH